MITEMENLTETQILQIKTLMLTCSSSEDFATVHTIPEYPQKRKRKLIMEVCTKHAIAISIVT